MFMIDKAKHFHDEIVLSLILSKSYFLGSMFN